MTDSFAYERFSCALGTTGISWFRAYAREGLLGESGCVTAVGLPWCNDVSCTLACDDSIFVTESFNVSRNT